jgi:maltose alpha-D-glucosyltransferase / alpha-amylase
MAGMWYENAIFYGVDIRRFQDSNEDGFGDLKGLISRLDYLAELGVDALWLLPFFDTPLRDNGYDIRDYYQVDPRVGTIDDFIELVEEVKKRKIRLVMDLVMNHTSDEHPWFQAARRDPDSRYRNYYSWSDSIPEKSAGGGPIFPGEEDSVWTYDALANAYYFHRFYHFQPGLHVANPEVQEEIIKVVDFWLSLGADGFRFDAAPIMTEAKGLEKTKPKDPDRIFKELHRFITRRNPEAVLLGEANVSMEAIGDFFGGSSEMNMLFNFMLGPHVLLAIARGEAGPLRNFLEQIYIPPEKDVWLNFLRNHDEFTLEKMMEGEIEAIFQAYAPEENMRIYGRGIRRRLAPMLSKDGQDMHRQKMELAFSLLFASPGSPLFMYGDEIGMGENLALPGREPVRTPMQWSKEENAGFSGAKRLFAPVVSEGPFGYEQVNVSEQREETGSFWYFVRDLIAVRKTRPEIGVCTVQVLEVERNDQEILVFRYPSIEDDQRDISLILFHNLSQQALSTTVDFQIASGHSPEVLFGNGSVMSGEKEKLAAELPPYGYLWVQI